MPRRKPQFVSGQAAGRTAKRVQRDGIWFASEKEGNRYLHLKILQRAGDIERLELQPKFQIVVDGQPIYLSPPGTRGRRPLTYIADFAYFRNNERIVEDVKGVRTKEFLIKRALAEAIYKIKVIEV